MSYDGKITTYLQTGSGAPSGAPNVLSGSLVFYEDETGDQVYAYNWTASAWQAVGGGASNHYPFSLNAGVPTIASGTQVNIGSNSSMAENAGVGFNIVDTGTNTEKLEGIYFAAPGATPYRVAIYSLGTIWSQQYCSRVFGWTDGTKYEVLRLQGLNANDTLTQLCDASCEAWTTSTSRATYGLGTQVTLNPGVNWAGLYDDGTNVHYQLSLDGYTWDTQYSVAKSSGELGSSGYTHIFVGINPDYNSRATHQSAQMTVLCYDVNGLSRTIGAVQ